MANYPQSLSHLLAPANHTQDAGPRLVGQRAPALKFPPTQRVQPSRVQTTVPPLCPPAYHRATGRNFCTDPAQPFVASMVVPTSLQHYDPPMQTCHQTPKLTMSSHPSMRADVEHTYQTSMLALPHNLTLNLSGIPGTNSFGYRFENDTSLFYPDPDESSNEQYVASENYTPGIQHYWSHLDQMST